MSRLTSSLFLGSSQINSADCSGSPQFLGSSQISLLGYPIFWGCPRFVGDLQICGFTVARTVPGDRFCGTRVGEASNPGPAQDAVRFGRHAVCADSRLKIASLNVEGLTEENI